GLYIDDVPYFDKGSFNFEFFDIEKIEVLRGPQGTLYGRNTMGGIIKIYTAEPKFNSTANLNLEYGAYNHIKTAFSTNQALGDKVALIVGGAYAHSDGYNSNVFSDTKADKFDVYNGRMKLMYTPTNRFKTILSLNFEKNKQNGYPYAVYNTDTQETSDVNYDHLSTYDRSLFSAGLTMEYRLSNIILTSSSSFQHMEDFQDIDQDFTPASLYYVTQARAENTFVEEFTLRSQTNHKLNWIAGVFAFKQSSKNEVDVTYGSDFITAYHLPGPTHYIKWYDQPSTGVAAFGQASYSFGKFKATAGIRLDYESTSLAYDYEKYTNDISTATSNFESDLNFSQILPKASISYHPTESLTTFLSVSKGYKVGGFNTSFETEAERSFLPESSYNYEFGIKSVCMDNRLITNLNFFYIDWTNQQITQPLESGVGSKLDNAGQSESKGLELEMRFLVNKDLTIWGSYGYNKAKFLEYQRDANTDYSDNYIPYIPAYTLNFGTNYTVNFNGKTLRNSTLTINYQHVGKLYWNDANSAYQENYGILNGRLNFHTKKVDFGIWGKNVLNSDYNAFYFEALGKSYVQVGKPVQYGVFVHVNI
ncbi:MAG: TonB-dependent receptor, partial [Bacteroidales bacterium]|nr:TonB-dependent receptor [Bacteroidales bacterium]